MCSLERERKVQQPRTMLTSLLACRHYDRSWRRCAIESRRCAPEFLVGPCLASRLHRQPLPVLKISRHSRPNTIISGSKTPLILAARMKPCVKSALRPHVCSNDCRTTLTRSARGTATPRLGENSPRFVPALNRSDAGQEKLRCGSPTQSDRRTGITDRSRDYRALD